MVEKLIKIYKNKIIQNIKEFDYNKYYFLKSLIYIFYFTASIFKIIIDISSFTFLLVDNVYSKIA